MQFLSQDVFWGCLAILFESVGLLRLVPAKKGIRHPMLFSVLYGLFVAVVNYRLCTGSAEPVLVFFLPYFGLLILGLFTQMDYLSLLAIVLLFPTLSTQTAFFITPFAELFGTVVSSWIRRVLPRLMLLPAFWFLKRFRIPGENKIPAGYGIPSVALSCTSILIVYYCNNLEERAMTIMRGILLVLCLLSFLLYYFYYRMAVEYTEKVQLQLRKRQLENQILYTQDMKEMYDRLRRLRHDSTNHFVILNQLLTGGEYKKASDYLNTLQKNLEQDTFVNTRNMALNAILNAKCSQAERQGVQTDLKILFPPKLQMNDADLCTMVGNLMDNALEACREDGGAISVSICQKQAYFLLEVQNTIARSVFEDNPTLETTKEEKEYHGLGIRIIRDIAEKYGGTATFKEKSGHFIAQACIPNLQEA